MPEETNTTPSSADPDKASKKKKKKQQRARGVWISFGGRIVAQVVGAAATIFLGILLVQKGYGPSPDKTGAKDAPPVVREAASQKSAHISVAVLPLDNFSADPNKEYFADGMTEALIAGLAQFDGLRVIRRPPAAPGSLVRLYIGPGDTNAAFNALDTAIRERSDVVSVLKVSPLFDDLRRDPRFNEFLRKASLS